MNNSVVRPNLNSNKSTFSINTVTVANKTIDPNLTNINIVENSKKMETTDQLFNIQLTEKEYSFEELMAEAQDRLNEAKKSIKQREKLEKNKVDKIDDLTDYQRIMLSYLLIFQETKNEGKTLQQILDEGNFKSKEGYEEHKKMLEKMCNAGLGDLKIVEIVNGGSGFDAIVLQFPSGEYLIHYPGTDENEIEDVYFDLTKIFEDNLSDSALDDLDVLLDGYDSSYNSQIRQAQQLSFKYLYKACENNTTLNFSAHSLGGSLAEESYLYAYNLTNNNIFEVGFIEVGFITQDYYKIMKSLKENKDSLGSINLYNPYHAILDIAEIDCIVSSGDLNLYCAQGDLVSSYDTHLGMFGAKSFGDVAQYVYFDYENYYNGKKDEINVKSDNPIAGEYFIMGLSGPHKSEEVLSANNAKYAFNEDGSLKPVEGDSFATYSNAAYGFNVKKEIKNTINAFNLENYLYCAARGYESQNCFSSGDIIAGFGHGLECVFSGAGVVGNLLSPLTKYNQITTALNIFTPYSEQIISNVKQ